ncbi:MAG: hypothetical protein AAF191_00960, partial [Verrucomicrobiota bacterium]
LPTMKRPEGPLFRHDLVSIISLSCFPALSRVQLVAKQQVKDGNDPDGGPPQVVFDNATKTYLQKMAFTATEEFRRLATSQDEN